MSDAAIAYKHYRVYVTRVFNSTYCTINQIKLFESVSRDALNIANTDNGATATASGFYNNSTIPENIISDASFWESNSTTEPKWVTISFPTAKSVRAFEIISNQYPNELPVDFKIQASNDNAVWVDLWSFNNNNLTNISIAPYLDLSGVSNLDNGNRSSRVLVYDWLTGGLLKSITPEFDGSWVCPLRYDDDVMVTHIGTSGYEPKSDGPIKPYSRK